MWVVHRIFMCYTILYFMFSAPLLRWWLLNLHQLGSWAQVMPGEGSNCVILKGAGRQSPGISAPFEITPEKVPSYGFSARSRPAKDPCWLQEAVDRSTRAVYWGTVVRSQGSKVPPTVREPVVLSKDWRRWKRDKIDVPEDHGPSSTLILSRTLLQLGLPACVEDVWLYWHCCPLMHIRYGLIYAHIYASIYKLYI